MARKGIEFTVRCDEITDFEKFNNNEKMIKELKELISKYEFQISIGFSDDDKLLTKGKILSETTKESKAIFTLYKGEFKRILEKYYNMKIKLVDECIIQFTTLY